MRFFLAFALVLCLALPTQAKPTKQRKRSKVPKPKIVSTEAVSAANKTEEKRVLATESEIGPKVAEIRQRTIDDTESRHYSFRIHSYLGLLVARASGTIFGVSVALAPSRDTLWHLGTEVSYAVPNTGSIFNFLGGAWRDFPVYGSSNLSLGLGLLAGPTFAAVGSGYSSVVFSTFLVAALCKEIDDLAVLRAEFRPGVVGGRFAFLMNLGVSFRFL